MSNMYYYITWFQNNYPDLHRSLMQCNHAFDHKNLNPYHLESDCWSHTMLVCKIAEIEKFEKVVQIAALLHDIGKPQSRTISPEKNNFVRFFGHGNISAYLSINILLKMKSQGMVDSPEIEDILILVAYHGELYKNNNPKSIYNKFHRNKKLYSLLKQINYCDNLGRFSANMQPLDQELDVAVTGYMKNEILDRHQEKSPSIVLLCGVALSGKSHYLNHSTTFDDYEVIDGENQEMRLYNALSSKKNIIIDLPNLTVLSRKKWLLQVPLCYTKKARLFLTPIETLYKRVQNRYHINNLKIDTMIREFQYPLYDEVDEIIFNIPNY